MATVTIDGTEHEVTLDDITLGDDEVPSGMVTTAKMTQTIQSEKAKAKRSAKTELLADDEHKREVLESYGVELRDDGTLSGAPKNTAQMEAAWKAKYLTPVEARATAAEQARDTFRSRMLDSEIVKAATEAGIQPAFLKPAPGQTTAPIVQMLSGSFAFDEDSQTYGVKEGDGFRYGANGQPAGASQLFEQLRTDEAFKPYFGASTMKGSGHQKTAGSPQAFTNTQIASMSDAEYAKNETAILAAMDAGNIAD